MTRPIFLTEAHKAAYLASARELLRTCEPAMRGKLAQAVEQARSSEPRFADVETARSALEAEAKAQENASRTLRAAGHIDLAEAMEEAAKIARADLASL